jgi:hypothetical protein
VALLASIVAGCGSSKKASNTTTGLSVSAPSSTTSATASTTASSGSSTLGGKLATGFWPTGATGTAKPLDAAKSFATDYLDIADPAVTGCDEVLTSAPEQCTATVKARGRGAATNVGVIGSDGNWKVASADSPDIKVTGHTVTGGNLTVTGESTAFEAIINVEIRALDWSHASPHVLAKGILRGGSNGAFAPITGSIDLPAGMPSGSAVLVLYAADASGQGTATAATVVPIDLP